MIVLNPMQGCISVCHYSTHTWSHTNGMPLATIFVKILQYFVLYAERDASPSELQELPCAALLYAASFSVVIIFCRAQNVSIYIRI